jgi:hypothetical protein
MNVADMQKVEAPVGEHNPPSTASELVPQRREFGQGFDLL